MVGLFTPYSTAQPLFGALPAWITSFLDQQRILSYQVYEEIYWNVPETFKLTARGSEDSPIYVPTARTLVDTTNRYVGAQFGFAVDPLLGSPNDRAALQSAMQQLFARERFRSQFAANKRFGLIRGDWLWHITADPLKAPGTRLTIRPLDPASYFPIYAEDDIDRVVGCHIVDQFEDVSDNNKTKIRRQTYRKTDAGGITVEEGIFALDKWEGPQYVPETVIRPLTALPPSITALPVYHVRNFEEPGNPFGSSELRGLERIMAAINQSVSDEELALALEGLGMYATDSGAPVDEDGADSDWVLGPGRVVELEPGTSWNRVDGVGSVAPYQDHIKMMLNFLNEASATPDAARGKVDVQVAESGVSLLLQLGPMLSKADEKDTIILDTHTQMFFDIVRGWLPAYEQQSFGEALVLPTVGDKLPVNRAAKFKELNDMMDRKVISAGFYRQEATKLGYVFPEDMGVDVIEEQQALTEATAIADPFSERVDAESADEEAI